MRHRKSLFASYASLVTLLLIWSSYPAVSQTPSIAPAATSQRPKVMAPHRAIPPRADKTVKWLSPAMRRSMIGGLWMTDANWKSSIYLRNSVETDPVTVTPILHLSNGVKYTLPDVTLQPAGNAIIDINQGLQQLGLASFATLSGYAEVQYTWPWDPFCATIRNIDTVHSLIFTYGLQPTMPVPLNIVNPVVKTPTHTIEGMWWKQEANVTGFVALANTSSQPIQATVALTDNQANLIAQHSVTISPQGMKLVNLPELVSAAGTQGGIQITSGATTDNLIVNGGLEDQAVGYSADLPFAPGPATPSVSAATTIAELGLMAGAADPMMLFPAGTTFTPYSVLRNVSDAPISVTPTLWWMKGALPHSAQLAPVSFQPHQTQSLDVMSLMTQAGLASATKTFNGSFNLVFDANIKPGDLLLASGSVDQTNTYVFEVVARTVAESGSKSLQYWSTGNGDDTMVTLWNPADEAQDFILTLFFALPDGSPGHYLLPIHLEPRATRTLNVSEIVQNQTPDAEGNTIPAGVHEGGMKIAGSQAENQHILLAVDSGTYNVRKATCIINCQECDGYSTAAEIITAFAVAVRGTQQQKFMATWNSGTQYDLTGSSTWSSTNTTVATVGTGLVTGVSVGSPTIAASLSVLVQAGYVCTGNFGCPISTFVISSPANVAQVTVTAVTPAPLVAGNFGPMSITGTNFTAFPGQVSVTLDGTGVSVTNASVVNDTTITALYSVVGSAPIGSQNLTVSFGAADSGSGATSNPFPVTVQAAPPPAPRIFFNGTDITGGPAQNVVVGQQIALTTSANLPYGTTIASNNWSVPGMIIGGYVNAAGNGPPDTTGGRTISVVLVNSSTTFYWVVPGQTMNVTYSYCLNTGPCSPTSTATFNVDGPVGATVTISSSSVNILNPPNNTTLYHTSTLLIDGGAGAPGMKFVASSTRVPPGKYQWVQLISVDQTKFIGVNGQSTTNAILGSPAIDTAYPYGYDNSGQPLGTVTTTQGVTNDTAADSPFSALPSTYGEFSRSFNATMYLMWAPDPDSRCANGAACTIPAPLGSVSWHWSGDAINTLQPQINQGVSFPLWIKSCPGNTTNGGFLTGGSLPQWNSSD